MSKSWMMVVTIAAIASSAGCDDDGVDMIDTGPPVADTGPGEIDAGPPDPPTPPCNSVGRSGGLCREGTSCVTGLTCMGNNLRPDITLGLLGIPDGMEDPMNPDELIPGADSTIPIGVTPGGLCSEGCDTSAMVDTCGDCSFCNDEIGGTPALGAVGIDIGFFLDEMTLGAGRDGICRARCDFDPETNGGCPDGYTCDLLSNTCLESCATDDQCNLDFGNSVEAGLVASRVPGAPYTCGATTGRCEWTAPPSAGFGAACQYDSDCVADNGFCFAGHCTVGHCAGSDTMLASGTAQCEPDGMQCLGFGGNNGSVCLSLCDTADDCFADQACDPQASPIPDGSGRMWAGACVLPCSSDTECQSTRVCDDSIQRFNDETLGLCVGFCDPTGGGLADAVTCEASELCVAIEGDAMGRGVCRAQDNICATNEGCFGEQACRIVGSDFNGRCEAACTSTAQCDTTAGEECVIVDTDPDDGVAETRGVCVAPGGACSPSPRSATDNSALRALRGVDGSAQCISTQTCMAPLDSEGMPEENAMGTCIDL